MQDRWIAWMLAGAVAGSVVSIAISSIFQGLAVLLWMAGAVRNRRLGLRTPPFFWFLAAFALWVPISLAFSIDPIYSFWYLPKVLKYLLVPLIFTFFTRQLVLWTFKGILILIAASSGWALIQYLWLFDIHLLNRIRGFMSHWMTFSGQVMMGAVALTGYLLLLRQSNGDGRRRILWTVALGLMAAALLLTYTRNAWLGAAVGVALAVTFWNWRWLIPLGLLMIPLAVAYPSQFQDRLLSSFDLTDTTVRGRLELLETGARMIEDDPLTGVGPMMVPRAARDYRSSEEFPMHLYEHLHNSALQIAAELGLPALLIWLALWIFLIVDLLKQARRQSEAKGTWDWFLPVNAICLIGAFQVSGLLEYNYGDAELAILLLFFLTAPYVVSKKRGSQA